MREVERNILLFQSTPPARGATLQSIMLTLLLLVFQSTPPARGATFPACLISCAD